MAVFGLGLRYFRVGLGFEIRYTAGIRVYHNGPGLSLERVRMSKLENREPASVSSVGDSRPSQGDSWASGEG